jgi:hypothetical protein
MMRYCGCIINVLASVGQISYLEFFRIPLSNSPMQRKADMLNES